MIKQWLNSYKPSTKNDAQQALREIMQEIALTGLYRSNFFEKAAFYGGTALRIFYGLNRYSEDLDFSLLTTDLNFEMTHYLDSVLLEFESLGMKVSVKAKEKKITTAIDSTFLKTETFWRELILEEIVTPNWQGEKVSIKIKLEVDTNPPLGFVTEEKLLLKPFSCYIKCFSAPDLFAGKMHALLFRKWKNRVKGRDWFDLEWYIKQGISINSKHLTIRAVQSKDWLLKKQINKEALMKLLIHKIEQVNFEQIKEDVIRFIPNQKAIEIWSSNYFLDLIKYLNVI